MQRPELYHAHIAAVSLSAGLTPRNHADLTLPGKKGALSPRGPPFLAGSPVFTACFPFTLWYAPRNSFSSWKAACLVCAWRLHEPEETQVSATQVPSCCCCEGQAEHQEKGLADMVWRVWSPPKHTLPSVSAVRSDSCKHSCLRTGVHFTQLCIRVGCESYCPNYCWVKSAHPHFPLACGSSDLSSRRSCRSRGSSSRGG